MEQNVVSPKPRIDESSNLCGLKLIMVTIYNSNDEITPNTYCEFWSRNGGLDCFSLHITLNAKKKCNLKKKFNYICTFHHLMEGARFFLSIFFIL
jgi:hypothetical protein